MKLSLFLFPLNEEEEGGGPGSEGGGPGSEGGGPGSEGGGPGSEGGGPGSDASFFFRQNDDKK